MVDVLIAIAYGILVAISVSVIGSLIDFFENRSIFGEDIPDTLEGTHSDEYTLTEIDKEYIEASREMIISSLGSEPVQTILTMNAEERIHAVKKLVEDLAALYELDGIQVTLFYDENTRILGSYRPDSNEIILNVVSLMTTHPALVSDFLDTICHELRHAVQWKMIVQESQEDYRWCNDIEHQKQIAYGLKNYIPFQRNPRAYRAQFVEMDAYEIAAYILEGLS